MIKLGVLLFPSIHFVLRAEKLMNGKGLTIKVIPVPRHLSSNCGVCLQIMWDQREKVISCLEEERLKADGVHPLLQE